MITGSTGIGNGKVIVSVDHDPTAVSTDVSKGSLILEEATGRIFCKGDDGDTTNAMAVMIGMPTGHIDGARMSFNTVALVDIAAGKVRDSADGEDIAWAGTLTADITASGANGLDTGAEASNTWYAVHVIAGGGNAVAALLSLSAAAPTLPGTYTVFRRVGWVRNDGSSDFLGFRQTGSGRNRQVRYHVALTDTRVLAGGSATVFTDLPLASYVPDGVNIVAMQVLFSAALAANRIEMRENGDTSGAVIFLRTGLASGGVSASFLFEMTCDDGRILEYKVSDASDSASIDVLGYQDEL